MNEDIADPLDWPVEFAPLREIDSHLRCPICKDLLRAAMMLQCHHNFCSECIRRHLDKESTCPACRVSTSTSQMRRNVTLDEVANSFKDCRSLLLKTVMDSLALKTAGSTQISRAESMDIDDSMSPAQKKRRISSRISRKTSSQPSNQDYHESSALNGDDKDDDFVMRSQELPRAKNASRPTTGPALRSRGKNVEQLSTVDVLDSPQKQPLVSEQPQPSSPIASTPTESSEPDMKSLVSCPICEMAIPEAYSNAHLDKYCLKEQQDPVYNIPYKTIMTQEPSAIELYEKQGISTQNIIGSTALSGSGSGSPQRNSVATIFNGTSSRNVSPLQNRTKNLSLSSSISRPTYPEPKRIPKLQYSILGEKQLRKKLQELGLPSHGDKQLMMKRHAEYLTIFNANCDATRPQTTAQLKKAMEVWERTYEHDMQAKEAQKRALEAQQRKQQMELVKQKAQAVLNVTVDATARETTSSATPPSSQGIASNGSGLSN
ncbi:E3 ubiquitin-protein ligase rad18, partial [Modicella reniformis]